MAPPRPFQHGYFASWFNFNNYFVTSCAADGDANAHLDPVSNLIGQLHVDLLEPAEVWHGAKILNCEWKNLAQ